MKPSPLLVVLIASLSTPASSEPTGQAHGARPPRPTEQSAEKGELARISGIRSQARGLSWYGDELLALGPDYRAVFSERGIHFTPALGRRAPRALPLTFELESIRRGDDLVYAPPQEGVQPADSDALVVEYERGPAITERYEILTTGVAQSFHFAVPPGTSGDLVVRGRISSPAELREQTASGSVTFRTPQVGGVDFGAVTGVDGLGRTAPGSIFLDEEAIELVLSHEFVETAAYPMVLDPLIGAVLEQGFGTLTEGNPAVAHSFHQDVYLLVWEVPMALNDVIIESQLISSDGTPAGPVRAVESGFETNLNPSVAIVQQTSRFLVTWQQSPFPSGPFDIRAASVDADSGDPSAQIGVSSLPANEIDPDVAGSRAYGSVEPAVVVWHEEGNGIIGATVDVPLTGPPQLLVKTGVSTAPGASKPAITRGGGASGHLAVVWQRDMGTHHDIWGQVMTNTPSLLGTGNSLIAGGPGDEERPDVATRDGQEFLVVFEREATPDSGNNDVIAVKTMRNLSTFALEPAFERTVGFADGADEFGASVDFAETKYVIGWTDDYYGTSDLTTYLTGLEEGTCKDCDEIYYVGSSTGSESGIEVCAKYSAQGYGDTALAVWERLEFVAPFGLDLDLDAQFYEATGPGGPVTNLGGGCGASGTAAITGNAALGANMRFQVTGASTAATFAVLVVSASGATLDCGPCAWLLPDTPGLLFVEAPSAGNAIFDVQLPCAMGALGSSFTSQWWWHSPGTSPCSLVNDLSFSNLVRFELGL